MSADNPLADRRQRAREAYHDGLANIDTTTGMPAVEDAIETATRVRIDDSIIDAAQNVGAPFLNEHEARDVIAAAFRAAGFEIEK